jgi:beta-glucosidase
MGLDEARAKLTGLTLAQRAALSSGADFWSTQGYPDAGIRSVRLADGPHGLRVPSAGADPGALTHSEPATCFPPATGLASTWNPDLVERVGAALAREAVAQGVDVMLGPGINIKRSPLGGRNFEYFSEDPLVSGVLGAAMVRGLQGAGVGGCPKHFAVNNQETDRMRVNAIVDDRALREVYLPAFEYIVRHEQPWTIMSAYNFVNGVAASNNPWLLTTVLRNEWGFDGLVMSDWGAVYDRVAAVKAGCDLEMPTTSTESDETLLGAAEAGHISEDDLDRAAAVVIALGDRVEAATHLRPAADSLDWDVQHQVALEAAREAIVLLKNDGSVLPLRVDRDQKVAVIGHFAERPRFQGGGSSRVNAHHLTNALDELRRIAPHGVELSYSVGLSDSGEILDDALQLATDADTTVLFVGLTDDEESEGFDRTDLLLPQPQRELINAVAASANRLVVVLSNGGVVEMTIWCERADAIIEAWLLGEAGGEATAEILFGDTSPNGKLAESIPRRLEDNPSYVSFPGEAGEVRYGEGMFVGYRYYDTVAHEVQYPFGHGLSYTTFDLSALATTVTGEGADVSVRVGLDVANTGSVAGQEVVQVYVAPLGSPRLRPAHELRAFTKVALEPGKSTTISFDLESRAFARWEPLIGDWVVDSGTYEIQVGVSSRDIRLSSRVELIGDDAPIAMHEHSTLAEWLAHPTGREVILAVPGVSDVVEMEDRLTFRLLEQIPVSKLSGMAGFAITGDELADMVDRANAELSARGRMTRS